MVDVPEPRRAIADVRVAIALALALVAALAVAAFASERPAGGVEVDPCADSAVVDAAATAGYECTTLFNKGGGQVVGRLFAKLDDGVLTVATDLDTLPDTGHSGVKLCIDDEPDPRTSRVSCLGGTAGTTVNRAYTIGTGGNQVKPAGNPPEEAAGKYEYMLEGGALPAVSGGTSFASFGPFATYTAVVGTSTHPPYLDFSFHFNQSLSIESFFNLAPSFVTLTCAEDTTFGGGDQPTYIVQIQGEPCTKRVLFSGGSATRGVGTQFVELRPATDSEPTLLFLEDIRWLGVPAGEEPRDIYFDDDHDGIDEPVLMRTCLSDPRTSSGGVPTFDIRDDLTVATAQADVLPAGHTSCLVAHSFTISGGQVFDQHIVFNVGDGLRMY